MYLNGRAAVNGPGGFARFHHEVAERLCSTGAVSVLEPPQTRTGPIGSRWWEQQTLLELSKDGTLLSTANNGPIRHPNQVVVVHDLLPLTHPQTVSPMFAALQRVQLPRLCRNAAAVLTVSEHVAGELRSVLGIEAERIIVVPPGISEMFSVAAAEASSGHSAHDDFDLDPNRPVVTALISSIPRKNSAEVLAVLSAVTTERPNVQVLVAGYDGPARVFGRRAVRPRHPEVRDLGSVDDTSLASMFAASDVFVSLSEAEGFGLPPVEALAAGAAVVSTKTPSLSEHFPGVAREVAGKSEAIPAVVELIDRPELRETQVLAAAAAVENLTWARTAAAVEQVLLGLEPHAN